jgi:hypothetical protein
MIYSMFIFIYLRHQNQTHLLISAIVFFANYIKFVRYLSSNSGLRVTLSDTSLCLYRIIAKKTQMLTFDLTRLLLILI